MGCSIYNGDINKNKEFGHQISWFDKIQLGGLQLRNRLVMAPLTRMRSEPKTNAPNKNVVLYYTQRSSFGLIITEGIFVHPLGNAFINSCGIYNDYQTIAWKKVVDSVHSKGGVIVAQLYHCGRQTDSSIIGDEKPLCSSPIQIMETNRITKQSYATPVEMTIEQIQNTVKDFALCAANCLKAGFDGIEIQAGNGFLVDQFLRNRVNQRTDIYGESLINRTRFLFEIIEACAQIYPISRIGVRITLTGSYISMNDSDPAQLILYISKKCEEIQLGFIDVKEANEKSKEVCSISEMKKGFDKCLADFKIDHAKLVRSHFSGFDQINGLERLKSHIADMIGFGTLAINNPDLAERFENDYPINNEILWDKVMGGGKRGYVDYNKYHQDPSVKNLDLISESSSINYNNKPFHG